MVLNNIKAQVEISKGSNIKYEIEDGKIFLDRILPNPHVFPYNYGYVPETLSGDGDPLDIIILSEYSLLPTCILDVKVIGVIETIDESGVDPKLIGIIPSEKREQQITDTESERIKYFLQHYKDNEKNKFVEIGNIYDGNKGMEIYEKDKKKYLDNKI